MRSRGWAFLGCGGSGRWEVGEWEMVREGEMGGEGRVREAVGVEVKGGYKVWVEGWEMGLGIEEYSRAILPEYSLQFPRSSVHVCITSQG